MVKKHSHVLLERIMVSQCITTNQQVRLTTSVDLFLGEVRVKLFRSQ